MSSWRREEMTIRNLVKRVKTNKYKSKANSGSAAKRTARKTLVRALEEAQLAEQVRGR